VKEAVVGYMGGSAETANYSDVSSGTTQHREAVKIIYDPRIISYEALIDIFWRQIDPTDAEGQFADKGFQYTTAIYYKNEVEKIMAEDSKNALETSKKFKKKIATLILPFPNFFEAEGYHQNYYKNHAFRYSLYKKGS
jgi:peptide methionine sulfoxide reductase msrA/msrB